jgi:hypothetical protein
VFLDLSELDCDLDLYVLGGGCETGECTASNAWQLEPEFLEVDCVAGETLEVIVEGFGFTFDAWYAYTFLPELLGEAPEPGSCLPEEPGAAGSFTLTLTPTTPDLWVCGCDAPLDEDEDGYSSCIDCDDTSGAAFPGAPEVPDGVDNNCDGVPDEGTDLHDDDGDGWSEVEGDCDDADAGVHPDAEETIDGRDEDCDDLVDDETPIYDDDGDGWSEEDGDCDDDDPEAYPGAPEEPDGLDQDCDGVPDNGTDLFDDDGDGWSEEEGDCDDDDPTVHPGAPEIEDGVDQDCDGIPDDGTDAYDDDGDGWSENEGDCDDDDPSRHPNADESQADGTDSDCDGAIDEDVVSDTGTAPSDDPDEKKKKTVGDCGCAAGSWTAATTLMPIGRMLRRRTSR